MSDLPWVLSEENQQKLREADELISRLINDPAFVPEQREAIQGEVGDIQRQIGDNTEGGGGGSSGSLMAFRAPLAAPQIQGGGMPPSVAPVAPTLPTNAVPQPFIPPIPGSQNSPTPNSNGVLPGKGEGRWVKDMQGNLFFLPKNNDPFAGGDGKPTREQLILEDVLGGLQRLFRGGGNIGNPAGNEIKTQGGFFDSGSRIQDGIRQGERDFNNKFSQNPWNWKPDLFNEKKPRKDEPVVSYKPKPKPNPGKTSISVKMRGGKKIQKKKQKPPKFTGGQGQGVKYYALCSGEYDPRGGQPVETQEFYIGASGQAREFTGKLAESSWGISWTGEEPNTRWTVIINGQEELLNIVGVSESRYGTTSTFRSSQYSGVHLMRNVKFIGYVRKDGTSKEEDKRQHGDPPGEEEGTDIIGDIFINYDGVPAGMGFGGTFAVSGNSIKSGFNSPGNSTKGGIRISVNQPGNSAPPPPPPTAINTNGKGVGNNGGGKVTPNGIQTNAPKGGNITKPGNSTLTPPDFPPRTIQELTDKYYAPKGNPPSPLPKYPTFNPYGLPNSFSTTGDPFRQATPDYAPLLRNIWDYQKERDKQQDAQKKNDLIRDPFQQPRSNPQFQSLIQPVTKPAVQPDKATQQPPTTIKDNAPDPTDFNELYPWLIPLLGLSKAPPKNPPTAPPITGDGGCCSPLGAGQQQIQQKQNTILDKLDALGQGADLQLLNVINNKLGNQLPGGLSGFLGDKFTKLWQSRTVDRALNLLNLGASVHNAAMLSRELAETLTYTLSNVLAAIGIKDADGNAFDLQTIVGQNLNNLIKTLIGADNYTALNQTWVKANRILTAGSNLLDSVRSMQNTIVEATEVVGGWVAKIGNGMQSEGIFSDDIFPYAPEHPDFKNPFFRAQQTIENLTEATESVNQLASSVIETQELSKQINQNYEAFKKEIETAGDLKKEDEDKKSEESKTFNTITHTDLIEGDED